MELVAPAPSHPIRRCPLASLLQFPSTIERHLLARRGRAILNGFDPARRAERLAGEIIAVLCGSFLLDKLPRANRRHLSAERAAERLRQRHKLGVHGMDKEELMNWTARVAGRSWQRKSNASSHLSEQRDRLFSGLTLAPCLRPRTGRDFGGLFLLLRLDPLHMQCTPFAEWRKRIPKRVAKRRKCIFNAPRDFLKIPSRDDAVRLHLLQMLDQHLLTDPLHQASQFSETPRLRSQRPQNQPFPFPAHDIERCVEAASVGLVSHSECS